MSSERDIEKALERFKYAAAIEWGMRPYDDKWSEQIGVVMALLRVGMMPSSVLMKRRFRQSYPRSMALILEGLAVVVNTWPAGHVLQDDVIELLQRIAARAQEGVPGYTPAGGPIHWERLQGTASASPASSRPTTSSLRRESWPPPAAPAPAAANTQELLRSRGEQITVDDIAALLAPGANRIQNEDIDPAARMAFTRQATSIARAGGGSGQFERDLGTCFITGYLVGRLALATHQSRVAYSGPGDIDTNCDRIIQGANKVSLAQIAHGSAITAFLAGAGKVFKGLFADLGDAGTEAAEFRIQRGVWYGYALAVAEHQLFVQP